MEVFKMKNKYVRHKYKIELHNYCILALFILIQVGCSSIDVQKDQVDREELVKLENQVKADPLDIESLKKLSILLVQDRQNEKANIYLAKALRLKPNDDALLFNQGLNYEFLNDTISAMNYYVRYREVSIESPYRKLMEGRYLFHHRNMVYRDIQYRIASETKLTTQSIPQNSLAIFPLGYYGADKKYEPLSRGFSEMLSIDLSKVTKLTVLERIRLKAIIDELEFSRSGLVDQNSAPRLGKILSAGLLYSGSYTITDDENLKMDLNSWNITDTKTGMGLNKAGKLEDLFIIEKELVFEIIDELGIQLTQHEKEQIELIPTKNINAFLEYSKGLEMQDDGNYEQAAVYFSNASVMDPNFKEASVKSDLSVSMSGSTGNKDEFLVKSLNPNIGENISGTFKDDIIMNRLDMVGESIRSNFDQGIEKRDAPQETAVTELPLPPVRPVR